MSETIIKTPSLKEQVYLYLKKAIVSGDLEVGKVYSEQWAAGLLGVSRTPVREAVLQLKQEYLVEILPYKGFQVKPLSIDEVKETFQIRQSLEGFCAILIAQHCRDLRVQQLLGELEGYLKDQEAVAREGSLYEFMELDEIYHREIVLYAGNERLFATYNEIRNRFERITVKVLTVPGRMEDTVQEHLHIWNKLKAGLPWEAYQAIQHHLDNTQSIMERKTSAAPASEE